MKLEYPRSLQATPGSGGRDLLAHSSAAPELLCYAGQIAWMRFGTQAHELGTKQLCRGAIFCATQIMKLTNAAAVIVITVATLFVAGCSHFDKGVHSNSPPAASAVEANINDRSTWVDPVR